MNFSRRKRQQGKPALDLLEEAVALLRSLPADTLFWYYLGTMPFALGLVFFWAHMSRSGLAAAHLAEGSFGLTLLWIWMKCCQAVFGERTRCRVMRISPQDVTLSRLLRSGLTQATISSWSLIILPIATVMTFPFGWCLTFFQNSVVLDRGDSTTSRELARKAWHQATLWPRQNHFLISILGLFSLIVFINLFIAVMMLPDLLKTLLGIKSIFGMGKLYLLNSTTWVVVVVLTYLCVDPLCKVACVLRCYHGEALHSGTDLLTELRLSVTAVKSTMVITLLLSRLFIAWSGPTTSLATEAEQLSPQQLDQAIDDELSGIEYSWRMPREKALEEEDTDYGFFQVIVETLRYWSDLLGDSARSFFQWLSDVWEQLFPQLNIDSPERGSSTDRRFVSLYLILGVALCLAAIMVWRHLKRRQTSRGEPITTVGVTDLDLENEEITASDLPTEKWLDMARDLMQKGERRLAIRAFHLATLARLAGDKLVTIAKAKSDYEYDLELRRHGLASPEVTTAFTANIKIFQQAWYGMHDIHDEGLQQFIHNQQRIMTDATSS